MSAVKIAICVNPMSGRDVRRLAARATNVTHEAKRDMVARLAAGACAMGATDFYITKEPFRIATLALDTMGLDAAVHVLDLPITHSASDTESAVEGFLQAGCEVIVALGGDGTNRAIVRALARAVQKPALASAAANVHLLPLSTGTNNVFPTLLEPTIAGMVAALQARGCLTDPALARRVKVLHVSGTRATEKSQPTPDVGLIDAVLLRGDHVGNLLPYDTGLVDRLLLTRAEPTAVGMSAIGGLIEAVSEHDDHGLLVEMAHKSDPASAGSFAAPVSPGHFRHVRVQSVTRIPFGVAVPFRGPGVLALDGDRDHKLHADHELRVEIRRDGPRVVAIEAAMRWAVARGMIARSTSQSERAS